MRKLKVDLTELACAFEDALMFSGHYLDLETGEVVSVTDEFRRELESIYEDLYEPEADEPPDLVAYLCDSNLPEWHRDKLLRTDQVERYCGTRYIGIPEADSHEDYRDMEDFVFTVEDEALREALWRALEGRHPFRRFKDVLAGHRRERERWFAFQDERTRRRVLDWLASEGIAAIVEPEPVRESPPLRSVFIAETLAFVRAASKLPGVTRIALLGSLVTEEPDPDDVDLLVTITDDMDVEPLATLGRKLAGHLQHHNRGADVFLSDPQGRYLGRTCPWKQCGPGIRASCDALHCGRRPYLHDDLETIRLDEDLVAAPPVELWPQVVARVPVPADVAEGLIGPLRESG